MLDKLVYEELDRKDINADLKSLPNNPERNVTNMFVLQDCFDADNHKLERLHVVCSCSSVKYTGKYKRLFSFVTPKYACLVYGRIF
jgi:hypothetical protein